MKRRRVLQVVASSRGGGAEVLRCLVKGLDPAQYESVVIMPDDGGQVSATDFAALGVQLERFTLDTGFNPKEFLRLRQFVRREHFDVLHAHGARAAWWGRLAAAGPRRPRIIFSVHGLSIVHYTGLKRAGLVGLERLLRQITDMTVCDSQAEQTAVLKWNIAAPEKTRVVWNGIDLERLLIPPRDRTAARAALQLTNGTPTLTTVCRLNKPRDFETLLAGMAEIVQRQPEARLLIVGDGPLRLQVENLIAAHRLEPYVRLLGQVRDVSEVLAAADVVLLITADWEGLPLAALEAMGTGKPMIISDVGGNREAIIHGETGYVIPPLNVPALVHAALDLLANPAQARQMGRAGTARVREHFTLQTMAAKTAEIYRAVTGN